ncbi:MAG: hypothetical protein WD066_12150 [Planctomycetaceae bacterium]
MTQHARSTAARPAATLTPGATAAAARDAKRAADAGDGDPVAACPRCGSTTPWGCASWCPDCGYYPKFDSRPEASVAAAREAAEAKAAGTLFEAIPTWAWTLGGGALAVAVFSAAASLMLPAEGPARAWWAVGQCAIGLIACVVAQFSVFFKALSITDRVGPMDIVFKPLAIWKPSLDALPEGAWRVWSAGWGLTGIVCAVAIIGGIRYSALFDDWGVKAPPKKNLVNAIAEEARSKGNGADSLSDALEEVGKEDEDPAAKVKLQPIDCLIIGFTKFGQDDFAEIFVASEVEGKLKYVARLPASEIPEEQRQVLRQRMYGFVRTEPFVDGPDGATWLEPVLLCRLKFAEWTQQRLLKQPKFDALLADAPRS